MTDDTIYRQAAIDAILHNQEVYSNNFGNDPIDKYTIAIIDNDAQTIAQLPSAQPEIVRCKDCKWASEELGGLDVCQNVLLQIDEEGNGFCSDGQRRDNENY